MKTLIILLSGLGIFLSSPALAGDLELPHIAVYGTARKMVSPDRAAWSLNIKNKGTVLKAVADTHADHVAAVIGYLVKMKIKKDDIQTSRMQFGENWEYRKGTRVREGYFASTDIAFKQLDIDRYDSLWMGLAETDTVSVRGVHFEISDRKIHQKQTRHDALLEARDKAVAMAKTLGVEVGGPLRIEELYPGYAGPLRATGHMKMTAVAEAAAPGEENAVAPGQIPVHSTVNVVFQLIDTTR